MKIKHKIISCFLALAILFNYLPTLHAEESFQNTSKAKLLKQLQQDYGSLDLNELYDTYEQVRISPEESPYYKKSYQELLTIYDQLNDDVSFLWGQNPEYIRQQLDRGAEVVVSATISIGLSALAAYCVGTYLAATGFPIAGELISYVPLNTSVRATTSLKTIKIGKGAVKIAKLFKKGKKVKDIAQLSQTINRTNTTVKEMLVFTSLMVVDGILSRKAFFALQDLAQKIQLAKREEYQKKLPPNFAISMKKLFKTANYLAPLFNEDVSSAQENREKYLGKFFETFDDLNEEDRIPSMAEYLRIGKVITTIHVLELIRAELSDQNNPIRYDMAAFDIFNYFFDSENKYLYTREELKSFLNPINEIAKLDKQKKHEQYIEDVLLDGMMM